jgi:PAS domain S-box-containing protein
MLMPERYREAHQKGMERLQSGGDGHIIGKTNELFGLKKDGTEFPLELSLAQWTAGNETFYTGLIRDITKRKRAEEALRESQRHQKAILDNIPDIAWLKDKESRIIAVNKPFGKSCGFKPEDLAGKTDLDIWPRELAERYRADDKEVMESGKRKQVEEPLTDSEDKAFWIETIKTPIFDEQGNVIGTVGIARDITGRKQAEEGKKKSLEQLRKALGATVQAIATIVETRDPHTAGHQRRVADLARSIASVMGLSKDQIDGIRIAARIHDIGKISVPAQILSMPKKLTDIEFSLIKVHAEVGYGILKDIDFPWPVARMVLEHHERMNGSGYPNRLTGENLLIESRILAVADVVEAIASHRPYRPALGIEAALEEIEKNAGVLYDRGVVVVCLRLFREKGFRFE